MNAQNPISLTLKRTFNAPVSRVYTAWTEPEIISQWFLGEEAKSCQVHEADVRVGGNYDFAMTMASGDTYRVKGIYREVVPQHKLVFTWCWDHAPDHNMLVIVEFRDVNGATQLTLSHTRLADQPMRDRHESGWTSCLDHLEAYLAS